jgi:hypothetical protein
VPKPKKLEVPKPLNPNGPTESRSIVWTPDTWAEFKLDDGTKIRIKPVLAEAKRYVDQFSADGQPAYTLGIGFITTAVGPRDLIFGYKPTKKKKSMKRAKKKK